MGKLYEYELYLCNSSYPYAIKGCLTNCTSDKVISPQLGNPDQLTFTLYNKYTDGTTNDLFTEIQKTNVIQVDTRIDDVVIKTRLFHVSKINLEGDITDVKQIEAYSLEIRMNGQSVRGFEYACQLYTGTTFNPSTPATSGIVDYILGLFYSNWTVNYVTPSLLGVLMDFNISEAKVLEAIKVIEQNFNCIFRFNSDDQTIDILEYSDDYDDFGVNTGIILDRANYVTKYTSQIDVDDIVTRLYITGSDDTNIARVNVTGEIFLDDFTFFMTTDYMTSGLISALGVVNGLRTSNQASYTSLLSTLSTYNSQLVTLNSELADLENELIILHDSQDASIRNGGTYGGKTYAQWASDITSKNSAISAKELAITAKEGQITSTNNSLDAINTTVSYASTLTADQLKELANFIQEETIRLDSSDEDVLLSLGQSYLSLKAQTQYDITIDLIDFYSAESEYYAWQKMDVGKKVNLIIGDEVFTPFVTSITHNIDAKTLTATVSNKNYLNDDINYLTSQWARQNQSRLLVDNKKKDWDTAKEQSDTATTFINSPIDVTNNVINIGDELGAIQQAQINRRGIYFRSADGANNQLRVLADSIVATKDNWANYSLAIDADGIRTDGTFKLKTANQYGGSNLVTIDGNGIKIYGSETEGQGLIIYNKTDTEVFKLDTSGNIIMTGSITITGGSGIGSLTDAGDLATLDSIGASNCDTTIISGGKIITGLLTADNIQAGTMTGRTIRTASSPNARIELTDTDVLAMYNSSNQKHGIYIDPNALVDFTLWKAGNEMFTILDGGASVVDIQFYGNSVMSYDNGLNTMSVGKYWDFQTGSTLDLTHATVTGLSVKFA